MDNRPFIPWHSMFMGVAVLAHGAVVTKHRRLDHFWWLEYELVGQG